MKTCTGMLLSLLVIGMLALSGCAGKPTLTPTQAAASATPVTPTATLTPRKVQKPHPA